MVKITQEMLPKLREHYLLFGSQIDSEGVLVATFVDSLNIEKGIITVTVHKWGSLDNGSSLPLVGNQATVNYLGLVSRKLPFYYFLEGYCWYC